MQDIVSNATFPSDLVAQIMEKSDGIPLFLEEITKAVLETHSLQESGEGQSAIEPPALLTVPSSLQIRRCRGWIV